MPIQKERGKKKSKGGAEKLKGVETVAANYSVVHVQVNDLSL